MAKLLGMLISEGQEDMTEVLKEATNRYLWDENFAKHNAKGKYIVWSTDTRLVQQLRTTSSDFVLFFGQEPVMTMITGFLIPDLSSARWLWRSLATRTRVSCWLMRALYNDE